MLKNEIFILEAAYRENQFAFETQFRSVHELKNLAGPEMKTGSPNKIRCYNDFVSSFTLNKNL